MVPEARLELARLERRGILNPLCLPIPPLGQIGAGNEARTRDPDLGKVVLYQLSYFRISGISECKYKRFFLFLKIFARKFTRQKSKKLSYNPSEPVFNAKSDYLTTESYSATTPQPPPNAL